MPKKGDFEKELASIFVVGARNKKSIIIKSGELHKKVGGYPGPDHRMPVCCGVLRKEMHDGDKIIQEPPKGNGANLSIEYMLPR
jgi:5-methylcytosine-specific restriction protein A